jgi:hypothetical protein
MSLRMLLTAGTMISTRSSKAARNGLERNSSGLPRAANNDVECGRYLVKEVAKCPECHTPRNERGELRHGLAQRAPIRIQHVTKIQNWADRALAGFPSFTEEQGERILEKGTGPEGEELRPPMHIYHMNRADAKAIIASLRSLPRIGSPN